MKTINLCFRVHQRYNLKRYRFFEIGNDHYYYDDYANESAMATAVTKMVNDSISAFVNKDLELANYVMGYDDIVDDFFDKIKHELIELLAKGDKNGEVFIDLLMIAKYLERIGDHATNIAESVEFYLTGARDYS